MVPVVTVAWVVQMTLFLIAGGACGMSTALHHDGLVDYGRSGWLGGNLHYFAFAFVVAGIWVGLPKEMTVQEKFKTTVQVILSPVILAFWGIVNAFKADPLKPPTV